MANDKSEAIFPDDADRLMSLEEVAARLRTAPNVVKALIDCGLLVALKFRSNRRVRKVTLNKFLEDHDGEDIFDLISRMEQKEA